MDAAILDLDGLLIDSEPLWRQAEQEVFGAVGLALTEDDCRRTTGLRCDAVVAYWYERRPWSGPSQAEVQRRLDARVLALVRTEGRAMPGVDAALDVLEGAGLRLAVASSSTRALIDAALERLGLDRRIAIRCSSFDESAGKPDPAVYLTAARELGVEPARCVAVEDSAPGVEAAWRAGMSVVAVPDPEQRGLAGFDRADVVLGSLGELTSEVLRAAGGGIRDPESR
jgi:sugar-phosphatase